MSEPKRIQRKRTKGWRMPEGAVYVGRPGKWGNPFTVGGAWVERSEAVAMYRDLIERIASGTTEPWMQDDRSVWNRYIKTYIRDELAGKDLACWCPLDQPCHADVLLEIANRSESS